MNTQTLNTDNSLYAVTATARGPIATAKRRLQVAHAALMERADLVVMPNVGTPSARQAFLRASVENTPAGIAFDAAEAALAKARAAGVKRAYKRALSAPKQGARYGDFVRVLARITQNRRTYDVPFEALAVCVFPPDGRRRASALLVDGRRMALQNPNT